MWGREHERNECNNGMKEQHACPCWRWGGNDQRVDLRGRRNGQSTTGAPQWGCGGAEHPLEGGERDSTPMNSNEVNLNINNISICPAINGCCWHGFRISFIFHKWYCKVSVKPSITPQGCWGDLARTAGVPSASAAERRHGAWCPALPPFRDRERH